MTHDDDRPPVGAASDLIAVLQKKAPRVATGIAFGRAAWPAAKWARSKVHAARTYTVKVPGSPGDALYEELHARILALIPDGKQRALVAGWGGRTRPAIDEMGNFIPHEAGGRIRLRYDSSRDQRITLRGHRIRVGVIDGQSAGGRNQKYRPPEIVFTAMSRQARDAVLAEIRDAYSMTQNTARLPSFWIPNMYDDWERLEDIPERKLDSVILPPGQLDRIIADVGQFLGSEAEYVRRCTPWHRGYAFWGPPGTGKTSAARAIASHFGLDVWYLPLADIKRDAGLLRSVHRIHGRSVLLLEDIDVFHSATRRDDEGNGVTLSGVLNMLDGIATPHGLIIVMTSNTPEVLQEAVIRAGRADLVEEFTLAGTDEVRRFLEWWYGEECPMLAGGICVSYADVAEACKRSATIKDAIAQLRNAAGHYSE